MSRMLAFLARKGARIIRAPNALLGALFYDSRVRLQRDALLI